MREIIDVYKQEKSYEYNYQNGPFFDKPIPQIHEKKSLHDFLGFKVISPLGIPAGPLLNSNWIKLYSQLGFDILTYKSVRSSSFPCHPTPNCIPIDVKQKFHPAEPLNTIQSKDLFFKDPEKISITNSFGVPSKKPKEWMSDFEKAKNYLQKTQIIVLGINASSKDRSVKQDYGYTASLAKEAGADVIEANYSCPNLLTKEGNIYADADVSAEISQEIRKNIGPNQRFIIKMGWLPKEKLREVIKKNRPFVDGFSGINTVSKKVVNKNQEPALPGKGRLKSGICGYAIADVAIDFTQSLLGIREELQDDFAIISVGGIMNKQDITNRLNMGKIDSVQSATAIMWNPYLGIDWKNSQTEDL